MAEDILQWDKLTPDERNLLIHTRVMGLHPQPCTQGQLDPYMGSYWGCTCGWVSPFYLGTPGESTEHNKPVPRYSESMDAAWLVVRRMNAPTHPRVPKYQEYANFIDELEKIVGSGCLFDVFYCDDEADHLTPARLCIAALRAIGYEIALPSQQKKKGN